MRIFAFSEKFERLFVKLLKYEYGMIIFQFEFNILNTFVDHISIYCVIGFSQIRRLINLWIAQRSTQRNLRSLSLEISRVNLALRKMSSSTTSISRGLVRTELPYLKNYKAYIGGKWKDATSTATFPVFNPASGEKLADVSNSGDADVKEAVVEAAQAFQSWKQRLQRYY